MSTTEQSQPMEEIDHLMAEKKIKNSTFATLKRLENLVRTFLKAH